MATTIVPAYDEPIVVTLEEVRSWAREVLVSSQGDLDKTTDPEDASFYTGEVSVLSALLDYMTGKEHES